jgi:hypothetical protein
MVLITCVLLGGPNVRDELELHVDLYDSRTEPDEFLYVTTKELGQTPVTWTYKYVCCNNMVLFYQCTERKEGNFHGEANRLYRRKDNNATE